MLYERRKKNYGGKMILIRDRNSDKGLPVLFEQTVHKHYLILEGTETCNIQETTLFTK